MEEEKTVLLAMQGDKNAFCSLYVAYKDRLFRYAYYLLGNRDDAADAVSDCVMSAYGEIGNLRSPSSFGGWIFRILYFTCIRYRKLKAKNRETAEAQATVTKAETYDNTDQKLSLADALKTLSDDEREIVLLCAVAGYKSEEIAALKRMTAGGVRSKLSRSLAKLRTQLEREEF